MIMLYYLSSQSQFFCIVPMWDAMSMFISHLFSQKTSCRKYLSGNNQNDKLMSTVCGEGRELGAKP